MCAKVSKKKNTATNASVASPASSSRATIRNTQKTPSKQRSPLAKGKGIKQTHNRSNRQSNSGSDNESDDEDNNESENESNNESDDQVANRSKSSDDDSIDFLGRPLSEEPSESNVDETNGSTQQSSRISVQRPSTSRRTSRKQAKPKKHKDHVLKQIRELQSKTNLLIPRLSFQRLAREVLQQFKNDFRWQTSSLECLQEAAESYMTQLFEDCYLCCLHRSRVTLLPKDVRLVQLLRGASDPGRL